MSTVAAISAKDVKALRDRTGAGMMDCKAALQEAGGDIDKAIEILRVKGQASAAKRGERAASEGVVASYIHADGQDRRAGRGRLRDRLRGPQRRLPGVRARGGPARGGGRPAVRVRGRGARGGREAELRVLREQAAAEGKPENVQEKIVEGRLRKWLEEVVLLNQQHVNEDKHGGKTIEEMRTELAANTGENVVIRRFARFEVGE